MSVTFLIFNRVIGTGCVHNIYKLICGLIPCHDSIFPTPSLMLRASGSVGMTFVIWIIGAIVAAAGTAVYMEFGTVSMRQKLS